MASLKKRGKIWYGIWYEGKGGSRKKKWKAFSPNKVEADRKLNDQNKVLEAKRYGHKTTKISWQGFCEEYLKWAKSDKSASSLENDTRAIRHFNNTAAIMLVPELKAQHLEHFKQVRAETVSDSTINRELDTLKSMGRKAHLWGYVSENPFLNVQKKSLPKLLPRFFSEKEMKLIRESAYDAYELMMVDIAYYTGMRRGELANLRWANIDFEEGIIKIQKNTGWITKERKEKVIPLDRRLETKLLKWKKRHHHEYVMALHDWPPVVGYFTELMEQILRRAGIEGSLHGLRHTLGNRLADKNVNLKKIADMMGHASTATTERYTATQIKTMRSDLQKAL